LATLDRAYVRPRYNGYLQFQEAAGLVLHKFLKRRGNPARVIRQFNQLYRESRKHA